MKQKILLSKRVPAECLAPYEDRFAFTMPADDKAFPGAYIVEQFPNYDAYLDIDVDAGAAVIDAAVDNGIKVIANYGVGYDRIDVDRATERGLPILNTPTSVTEATAELGATLIFTVMRGVPRYDAEVRKGVWIAPLFSDRNTMISGSVLGIVGFGRIGKRVCRKAQGMGMTVVYYDAFRAPAEVEAEYGVRYLPLDELLGSVDAVSVHVPYFPENHHMFNAETFRKMKPTAYFINTARGKLVDEAALCEALRTGVIKGAALDVFETEPNAVYPGLLELDNVVLTPHIASLTMRSRVAMANEAIEGLVDILEGRRPHNIVNPSVLDQ